jgi:hypothetical protein
MQLRHQELVRRVIRKDLELDTQRDPLITPFIYRVNSSQKIKEVVRR